MQHQKYVNYIQNLLGCEIDYNLSLKDLIPEIRHLNENSLLLF